MLFHDTAAIAHQMSEDAQLAGTAGIVVITTYVPFMGRTRLVSSKVLYVVLPSIPHRWQHIPQ